ncbi:MAG TPA: type II toxin-antitoxin system HicA family toxin [Candidatus Hydrogenedentes bacterium]|nr:type II toxin-antitoxin system HicA family toxin [Candidatus Hydrogenedentota bacterium]
MKRQYVIEHLRACGCRLVREGACHSWWENPVENRRSSLPRHTEIRDNLVIKICKDLGIPKP